MLKLVRESTRAGNQRQFPYLGEAPEDTGISQQVWETVDVQMSWRMDADHVTDLAVVGSAARLLCGQALSPPGFASQQSLCHPCGPRREENGLNNFSARKCGCIEIKSFRRSSSSLMTSSAGLLERIA